MLRLGTIGRPFAALVSVTVMVLGAHDARAAEGRIPIPFTSPVTTPIVITAPGRYVLTRNLRATSASEMFRIALPAGTVGGVDLDLNGFTLDATPVTSPLGAIFISLAGGTQDVTVHDGMIQGGPFGIRVFNATSASLRKLAVERVQISNTTGGAIYADRPVLNLAVRDSVITDSGGYGIRMEDASALMTGQALIEGNQFRNTAGGIYFNQASNITILNNRFASITGAGPSGPNAIHLRIVRSSLVSGNSIYSVNGGNGVRLEFCFGTKVSSNTIEGCNQNGILVDGGSANNLVDGNVVTNSGRGFVLAAASSGNVYRANVIRGNTGAIACAGACSSDFCTAGAMNTSQGDNFMPATAAAPPACEK